jgi:hypothetical protein
MDVKVKGVGKKIKFLCLAVRISVRQLSDEFWVNYCCP